MIALSLPSEWYSAESHLAWERAQLFGRSWIGVGREDLWPEPGSYIAVDLAGLAVLVLRDEAGEFRAFANSCRHRGTRLLKGQGTCRAIVCPFHGWRYGLDGRLIAAPRMSRSPGFAAEDHGLVPLRVGLRDGFAFLCCDQEAPSLDEWLGNFSDVLAPWAPADLVTTRRRAFEVDCNWKLFLDVFNEYYHLPFVHTGSIGGIYDRPDALDEATGCFASQFGTHDGASALLADDQGEALPGMPSLGGRNREGTRYTWVFPSMTFALARDCAWIYEARPITPARTRIVQSVCFPRSSTELPDFETRAEAYYRRIDTAIAEDIAVLEEQQAGIASPLSRPGPYAELEPSVSAFSGWLRERLGERPPIS